MSKASVKKFLEHPDKDEIISKLVIGITPLDIHEWLKGKYTNVSESRFVIPEKVIDHFNNNYLDIYNDIKEDLQKTKALSLDEQAHLSVQNNPNYKETITKLANNELDIKKMITNLIMAVETRASQVFDLIQEDPRNIKMDRRLIEYFDSLGNMLEKYHKIVLSPSENVINNTSITVNMVDEHMSVFYDIMKEILSKMDVETSLYFMEIYNEKMSKLKLKKEEGQPNQQERMAEVKILSETIHNKINETYNES